MDNIYSDEVFQCVACKKDTPESELQDLIALFCESCTKEDRRQPSPLGDSVCPKCWLEMKMEERCSGCGSLLEGTAR